MKPVSAVIVSYNDRDIMSRCLEALAAQMTVPGDEIIVVDNGSTDGVLEDLRARTDRIYSVSSTDDRHIIESHAENMIDQRRAVASVYETDQERMFSSDRENSECCPLILVENGENAGFPVGCNIGYAAAAPGNDIFLLNNDAVLSDGALDRLREALYSAEDVGAVGAVSNNALEQIEPGIARNALPDEALAFGAMLQNAQQKDSMVRDESSAATEVDEILPGDECREYAVATGNDEHQEGSVGNIRGRAAESHVWFPYEYRSRLTGFAVLLKRDVVDKLVRKDRYFLDPRFSPGYFEDEDLGVRVALAGYRQILCHNAFIYHKGGTGFASHPEAMERGRQKFIDKWGFDIWAYIGILEEYEQPVEAYLEYLHSPAGSPNTLPGLRILELDCGMGVNLAHLQYLYPGSYVIGIEREPILAQIAAQLIDVICAEPDVALKNALTTGGRTSEAAVLPPGSFDIIFAWDACERSAEPEEFRNCLEKLLKPGGKLV